MTNSKSELSKIVSKTLSTPYSVSIQHQHKDAIQKQSLDDFIREAKSNLQSKKDITLILIKT